jgi:DNA modification methylase
MNWPRADWQTEDGRVRLFCGDALELMSQFPANAVDMIWTDPPFGHGNQQDDLQAARVRDGVKGARVKAAEPIANDAGVDFEKTLKGFLDQAGRVLNRDCCCCCCMAGGGPNVTFAHVSEWVDERLAFFMAVVWDKSARGNGMGWRYRRNYEFVLVAHRKGGRLLWADDSVAVPNIVRDMPVIDRIHPNEKPVRLIRRFIDWHTKAGQLVMDPFMGSGSTIEAAMQLNRPVIGIESDRRWFDVAVRRIEKSIAEPDLYRAVPLPQPVAETPELFTEVA